MSLIRSIVTLEAIAVTGGSGFGPHRRFVGPRDPFVAAQAEGMPDRVGVDLPAVALGPDEVLLQCRAELDDATLFGLDFVHFEVEVVLLGVCVVGPARRAVVRHPLEGEIDFALGDAGQVVATALHDGAACHLGVEAASFIGSGQSIMNPRSCSIRLSCHRAGHAAVGAALMATHRGL